MSSTNDSRCQVLNISNVNHKGEVVLNDERLLELIQQYPFLFNPRVHPFNDPDFDDYAWEKITTRFRSNYENKGIKADFSKEQLKQRWKILQPIIKSLSKVNDISSVPASLRKVVVKMSVQLDDQVTDTVKKPLSAAQKVIMENIDMVKRLPMNCRMQLEADMMNLLFSAELCSKGTVKVGAAEKQLVDIDCGEFLRTIHFDSIDLPEEEEAILSDDIPFQASAEDAESVEDADDVVAPDNTHNLSNHEANRTESQIDIAIAPSSILEQSMLEPLPPKRWIPLAEARFHVRKCIVRVKRTNMEDYIPLATFRKCRIKKERH